MCPFLSQSLNGARNVPEALQANDLGKSGDDRAHAPAPNAAAYAVLFVQFRRYTCRELDIEYGQVKIREWFSYLADSTRLLE